MHTRVPLLDKLLYAGGGQGRWEPLLDEAIAAVKKALDT